MDNSKHFVSSDWIFEINKYDIDKSTVLLAEIGFIFSKPIGSILKEVTKTKSENRVDEIGRTDVLDYAKQFFDSFNDALSLYIPPKEMPGFLRNVLNEVRCKRKEKSNADFIRLIDVYNEVFSGKVMEQFIVAKEVLLFNFQDELIRFFGPLLGLTGTTEEAKKATSQTTLTQVKTIKAR